MEDGLVLLLICERGDKEHNEESGQQQQCLLASKGLDGSVKFNPTLQKEMEMEERCIKKINDCPEARWGHIYICAPRTS